jgi:hypothetical protein
MRSARSCPASISSPARPGVSCGRQRSVRRPERRSRLTRDASVLPRGHVRARGVRHHGDKVRFKASHEKFATTVQEGDPWFSDSNDDSSTSKAVRRHPSRLELKAGSKRVRILRRWFETGSDPDSSAGCSAGSPKISNAGSKTSNANSKTRTPVQKLLSAPTLRKCQAIPGTDPFTTVKLTPPKCSVVSPFGSA